MTVTVPVYVFHYEKLVIQRYFTTYNKSIFNVNYTYKIVVTLQTCSANFGCDSFAVFNCF